MFHQKMANAFYVSECVSQRLVHEFKGWNKKLHKHDMQQLLTLMEQSNVDVFRDGVLVGGRRMIISEL